MSQRFPKRTPVELDHVEALSSALRGKLQFMDYLVRAAVSDVERLREETDPATRSFIRQLIEMHASNLALECENMRVVRELGNALEVAVNRPAIALHQREETA